MEEILLVSLLLLVKYVDGVNDHDAIGKRRLQNLKLLPIARHERVELLDRMIVMSGILECLDNLVFECRARLHIHALQGKPLVSGGVRRPICILMESTTDLMM